MSLDVLNPVSIKRLKGIGGFTYASDADIDNVNIWRANLLSNSPTGFSWTRKADPLGYRTHFGMGIVGSDIYYIGGPFFGADNMALTKYNIPSNTHIPIASVNGGDGIPLGRYYMASGIYNGYFYIFCGDRGSSYGGVTNESWRVNLTTGVWERLANAPMAIATNGCFGSNGIFYIHCGSDHGSPTPTSNSRTWSYNPTSDTWVSYPLLPAFGPVMDQNEMAAIGNYIYSVGGTNEATDAYYANNQRYDIDANTWWSATPMAIARNDHAIAVMDGRIYVFGGDNGVTSFRDAVRYDPVSNTWAHIGYAPSEWTWVQNGRAVAYGYDIYIQAGGQMWKFSSSEIEKFAVKRFY